jgi:hypothetical protein
MKTSITAGERFMTLRRLRHWATTSHHHKSHPRGAMPCNYEKVEIHEINILSRVVYLHLSPNMESASMWNHVTLKSLTAFTVLVSWMARCNPMCMLMIVCSFIRFLANFETGRYMLVESPTQNFTNYVQGEPFVPCGRTRRRDKVYNRFSQLFCERI